MREPRRGDFPRLRIALVLFGVSFGFIEAAVVIDLRAHYEPIHRRLHPDRSPGDLFPMIRLDQLRSEGELPTRLLGIEVAREAATMILLAAIATACARDVRTWFAAFVVAFGIWDLAFYLSLKLLANWPESLLTWDLLFLIPVPWTGPVLAPVLVSLTMIATGLVVLLRESAGRPVPIRGGHWAMVVVGGLLLVLAFCWDWRNILAGGLPNPFPWPLFALGEAVGLVGFLRAILPGRTLGVS